MKQWWRNRRPYILAPILYAILRFIAMTLRLTVINYERVADLPTGKIFCGWHGRSLIPGNYFRKRGYWVIISQSRDGEFQNLVFRRLGYNTIRGSTGRGGVRALVESIKVLKKGAVMAITPDGPRGPMGVVQDGVMMMAQKSGCALIPVATHAKPALFVPTWDSYMFPLPFARAVFILGEPIYVAADATPEQVEELRLRLQSEIHRLQAQAEAYIASGRRATK